MKWSESRWLQSVLVSFQWDKPQNKSAFYFYLPDVWSSRADWFLCFETIILSLTVRQKGAKNGGGGNGDAADLSSNPRLETRAPEF